MIIMMMAGVVGLLKDWGRSCSDQLQPARPIPSSQVANRRQSSIIFRAQHTLGLCHGNHLRGGDDIGGERHPAGAGQGRQADVLRQVGEEKNNPRKGIHLLFPGVPTASGCTRYIERFGVGKGG